MLIVEEPEAENMQVGVTAKEKMSVGAAGTSKLGMYCWQSFMTHTLINCVCGKVLFRLKYASILSMKSNVRGNSP